VSGHEIILPAGWPRPSGYSNGIAATGRIVAVGGQIGWNPVTLKFESVEFVDQVRATLTNVVSVLRAAGATPEHVVRMTWFITDRDAYVANTKRIGEVYREVFGRVYPALAVVVVAGLIEAEAMVEIEATAVVPIPMS
jgi:enamine deaminase RidA (YjgF/YER057c/UK114 family)